MVSPPRVPLDPVHRANGRAVAAIPPAPVLVPQCFGSLSVVPLPPAGSVPNTVSLPLAVPFLQSVSSVTVSFLGFTPCVPITGTAKHHPSLAKKAVAAYETEETDRHIGIRGVTTPVATSIASRYQSARGLFGNEFVFTNDTENALMPARKGVLFPYTDSAVDRSQPHSCTMRRADSESRHTPRAASILCRRSPHG